MPKAKSQTVYYGLIAILLVALGYPVLVWLVRTWSSNPYYSHGFLILPVAALLAWRQWRHVTKQPRGIWVWTGIPVILISLGVVVWALWWRNYVAASLALIMLLIGILLFVEGWARVRPWLFPLLFLLLMVPLPFVDLLSPWLEAFTARAAADLAQLAGLAVTQQGGEIALPGTTIVVGAPCSGLRSLTAMVTLGFLWIYLVQGKPWAKAVMLIAILPVVALSNVLRITLLLFVAQWFGEEAALGFYHDWSSPVIFILSFLFLFGLAKVLGCAQLRDDLF